MKWASVYYSNFTKGDVEKKLNVRICNLIKASKPIQDLRGEAKYDVSDTKEKVYTRLVEYLHCEPYPSMAEDDFQESNLHDMVKAVLLPTLSDFKHKSKCDDGLTLHQAKEILWVDPGFEDFIFMNFISSTEESEDEDRTFVLVVEAKQSLLAAAFRQLLLALNDMWDSNGKKGVVYGFAVAGEDWHMVTYDGKFRLTDKFTVMFPSMGEGEMKEKWMREYSVVVDLLYIALEAGGCRKLGGLLNANASSFSAKHNFLFAKDFRPE